MYSNTEKGRIPSLALAKGFEKHTPEGRSEEGTGNFPSKTPRKRKEIKSRPLMRRGVSAWNHNESKELSRTIQRPWD